MPTTIACPKCQTKLNLPDSALGKQVRCPKCSATLRVPAPSGGAPAQPSGSPPARPAPSQKPAAAAAGKTTIRCPGCNKQLAVSAALAGKVVQCPQCSKKLKVPGGKPAAGPAPATSPSPAAPQAPADPFGAMPPAGASGASPFDFGAAPSAGAPAAPAPSFGPPSGGFPSGPAAGTPSPYAPPQGGFARPAPGGAGASGSGDRTTFYMVNGILITLWGIFILLGSLLRIGLAIFVLATREVPNETKVAVAIDAFMGVVGLILGLVMTRGGIGMAMRNSLTSARTAAVVAAIPCFGLCVFPFGIWACVLVFSEQAKRDFNK